MPKVAIPPAEWQQSHLLCLRDHLGTAPQPLSSAPPAQGNPASLPPLTEPFEPLGNSGTQAQDREDEETMTAAKGHAAPTPVSEKSLAEKGRTDFCTKQPFSPFHPAGRGSKGSLSDPGITQQTAAPPHPPGPIRKEGQMGTTQTLPAGRLGGRSGASAGRASLSSPSRAALPCYPEGVLARGARITFHLPPPMD